MARAAKGLVAKVMSTSGVFAALLKSVTMALNMTRPRPPQLEVTDIDGNGIGVIRPEL